GGRCASRSFLFSSRRRHTRFSRDWSSDVCSSDLTDRLQGTPPRANRSVVNIVETFIETNWDKPIDAVKLASVANVSARTMFRERSEERRVGRAGRQGEDAQAGEEKDARDGSARAR